MEQRAQMKEKKYKQKYSELKEQAEKAKREADAVAAEITGLESAIVDLTNRVKAHGAAAVKITKLVHAYLGHGELTVIAANEGYELHRHGKLVKGPPSEGEKTAIALCYFLSTLESDGRKTKDLILVFDDPISSLDSRAMNYASTLIRTRVEFAAQVFVMTHNQHCMNEFKKGWKNRDKSTDTRPATASFLFMDVSIRKDMDRRETAIIEMPKQLRAYDSEYHYLFSKVIQFEASESGFSEYWFMMPNVIRRVLDVFLGFKVPGTHPIEQKLEALTNSLVNFDPIRAQAIARLVQVESHSDNLDDLIAHSSMTIEEMRDANAALLTLMEEADADHTLAIRKQCKA